jgi:hypothetical protein
MIIINYNVIFPQKNPLISDCFGGAFLSFSQKNNLKIFVFHRFFFFGEKNNQEKIWVKKFAKNHHNVA